MKKYLPYVASSGVAVFVAPKVLPKLDAMLKGKITATPHAMEAVQIVLGAMAGWAVTRYL